MAWQLKQFGSVVDDFLAGMAPDAEARIRRDLRRLSQEGYRLKGDLVDSLGNGLRELRTAFRGMAYRCIFIYHSNEIVILHCFVKKTKKTPKKEIDLALARYREIVSEEIDLGEITVH